MPDRELRHMRRTELVEIILALKQSEDRLRAENAALSAQLQERQIHIENAGSIAQAALELNKVFEAAQAAADEYVASVLAANKNTDAAASALRAQAEAEAQQILAQAQTEAANLKARTQQQCDAETEAAARKRAQTEADCKAMLARTQQEIQQRRAAFDRRAANCWTAITARNPAGGACQMKEQKISSRPFHPQQRWKQSANVWPTAAVICGCCAARSTRCW